MTERDRSDLNIKSEIKTIDSPPAKRLKSTNEQTLGKSAGRHIYLAFRVLFYCHFFAILRLKYV